MLTWKVSCRSTQKLDQNERVGFREALAANSIEVDAWVMLMIDKGFLKRMGILQN